MIIAGSLAASRYRPYLALIFICVVASAFVVSTYSVFGHTWDEPEHLAAGIALLDTGDYPYDQQHPPLARVAMAIGPFLAGAHSHGNAGPSGEEEGRDILYDEGHYDLYLALARLGMLPFLIALITATWLWTRRLFGVAEANLAAALTATTPVLLGHAGVAALDIPMVGTSMIALFLLLKWMSEATYGRAIAFGLAAGIAAGTKLSSIPFIGCVAVVWFLFATLVPKLFPDSIIVNGGAKPRASLPRLWTLRMLGQTAVGTLVAAAALVACYGFIFEHVVASFTTLLQHNQSGHLSYFLGELRRTGWWDFYVIALTVKTPLPLLFAGLFGTLWLMVQSIRERSWVLSSAALAWITTLVFASAYSHINIGVRHVLLIFPLLAINAAVLIVTVWRLAQSVTAKIPLTVLLAWQAWSLIGAHPDFLPYFNELAGAHPERILVDSDLDWGQDLRRLKRALAERDIKHFSIVYRGTADLTREGFTSFEFLWPHNRATGWIAVSLLAKETGSEDGGYDWLNAYQPVTRIGKSIDLYYIKE